MFAIVPGLRRESWGNSEGLCPDRGSNEETLDEAVPTRHVPRPLRPAKLTGVNPGHVHDQGPTELSSPLFSLWKSTKSVFFSKSALCSGRY